MKTRSLSDQERVAWLRLIRTERIGPTTFQQLMDRFGWNAQKVLDALPELTRLIRSLQLFRLQIHVNSHRYRTHIPSQIHYSAGHFQKDCTELLNPVN